jgi:hypothetical protein
MKVLSNWRSVRLWETQVERDLHRNYSLRTHGILIGSFTLLLMWCVSALQMHLLHVDSLAVRYFLTLGVGYLGYLLVLRWVGEAAGRGARAGARPRRARRGFRRWEQRWERRGQRRWERCARRRLAQPRERG